MGLQKKFNIVLEKKSPNKAFTASNLKYSMTGKKNSKRGSVTKGACAFFEIESQSKTGYEIYPCVTQSVGLLSQSANYE